MNHNDLPAFSGKCEDVVIDPPIQAEVAGCAPIPAGATGDRILSIPARLSLPSDSAPRSLYPLDHYCFPARRPLALHLQTARRTERAAIVQADCDKSIDPDQQRVKM